MMTNTADQWQRGTLIPMERSPTSDHWKCPRCGYQMGSDDLLSVMIKTSECNCIGLGVPEGYWRQENGTADHA